MMILLFAGIVVLIGVTVAAMIYSFDSDPIGESE